jgi:hypothetical protein
MKIGPPGRSPFAGIARIRYWRSPPSSFAADDFSAFPAPPPGSRPAACPVQLTLSRLADTFMMPGINQLALGLGPGWPGRTSLLVPRSELHRTGTAWTLRTVAAILANPRYTGRRVRNRQRTDLDLIDPASTGLGHKQVQRWNLPEGWVISKHPAHPALVSEADFIVAQDAAAPRGPAGPTIRRYLLAGLLACARCGRRLESAGSNGRPAYWCRHGYTSAAGTDPGRPRNTYVREDQILPIASLAADRLGRAPRCSPAWPGRKAWPAACHGPGCGDLMRRPRR